MSTPALHLTSAAKTDLQRIWHYTVNQWGKTQAERYIGKLKESCHTLLENPSLGKPLPQAGEHVRVLRSHHHYIFYLKRENEKQVIFLAFLHEKQDVLRHILTRLP